VDGTFSFGGFSPLGSQKAQERHEQPWLLRANMDTIDLSDSPSLFWGILWCSQWGACLSLLYKCLGISWRKKKYQNQKTPIYSVTGSV